MYKTVYARNYYHMRALYPKAFGIRKVLSGKNRGFYTASVKIE